LQHYNGQFREERDESGIKSARGAADKEGRAIGFGRFASDDG
jgi:hypothetical protein